MSADNSSIYDQVELTCQAGPRGPIPAIERECLIREVEFTFPDCSRWQIYGTVVTQAATLLTSEPSRCLLDWLQCLAEQTSVLLGKKTHQNTLKIQVALDISPVLCTHLHSEMEKYSVVKKQSLTIWCWSVKLRSYYWTEIKPWPMVTSCHLILDMWLAQIRFQMDVSLFNWKYLVPSPSLNIKK